MKKRIIYFLLALLPVTGCLVQAQPQVLQFRHLTIQDGLSHNLVSSIVQDKDGFLWFATPNGLNRYDGREIKIYRKSDQDTTGLQNNAIRSLLCDSRGQLWVGTRYGLVQYDRRTDRFISKFGRSPEDRQLTHLYINCMIEDSRNRIWIGTYDGLNVIVKDSVHQIPYFTEKTDGLNDQTITALCEDKFGSIWIGTKKGLDFIPIQSAVIHHFSFESHGFPDVSYIRTLFTDSNNRVWMAFHDGAVYVYDVDKKRLLIPDFFRKKESFNTVIRCIVEDQNGHIWFGDAQGLHTLDSSLTRFSNYPFQEHNPFGLSDRTVTALYQDRQGLLWAGTYHGGCNYAMLDHVDFYHYHKYYGTQSISNNIVRCFYEEDSGNLWIGTERGGLNYFDRHKNTFRAFPFQGNTEYNVLTIASAQNDWIYVSILRHGLFLFHTQTHQFAEIPVNSTDREERLKLLSVQTICRDRQGNIWIGGHDFDLMVYDPKTNSLKNYKQHLNITFPLSHTNVNALLEDSNGNIWAGAFFGLNRIDQKSKTIQKYYKNKGLRDTRILSLYEDSKNRLWVGTRQGLHVYDRVDDFLIDCTEKEGLPGVMIFGIREDDAGTLWISTSNGLIHYDPETGSFHVYNRHDGLQSDQFRPQSCLKTRAGELLFGGVNGFNLFHPDQILKNNYIPPVVIRTIEVQGQPVPLDSVIVLPYWKNNITFEFSALNFWRSEKNLYQYRLSGLDKTWHFPSHRQEASYTNLSPNTYTFHVKGSNNDGLWNETGAKLTVIIEPPFWKTWWAYTLYSLIILLVMWFVYRDIQVRHQLQIEQIAAEQQHAFDLMKLRFFTNISHEFRTPLTLIKSPLEKMISTGNTDKRKLKLVYRSVERLIRLINQLLDFRKLEAGSLRLEPAFGDIVSFVKKIHASFQLMARERRISYKFISRENEIKLWFDPDKLDKIMYNLLSNAFKFTSDGGEIRVQLSMNNDPLSDGEQGVQIMVKDTGSGISAEYLPHIFERYYQTENTDHQGGTGIGLALVKEMVELHQGQISVQSKKGTGTTFQLMIPMNLNKSGVSEAYAPEMMTSPEMMQFDSQLMDLSLEKKQAASSDKSQEKPVLLIVEDNPDLRLLISDEFSSEFDVHEAEDGKKGYALALDLIPDIVISDVMMPAMNGMELCKQLKENKLTSHVPVILLTAKSSEAAQVEGLETGADDYVTKPFNMTLLNARVYNIITSRKKLREKFSGALWTHSQDLPVTSIDETFTQKLIQIIQTHMTDPNFSVDALGKEIDMGRVQLYRKIKQLMNLRPSDLIRILRLKYAARLLSDSGMTVSEVAYESGFKDHSNFSKIFTRYFGQSPSQHRDLKS